MTKEEAFGTLAMVQTLARKMLEVGSAEPYSHLDHKDACEKVTQALRVIAEQGDVK